MHPALAKFSKQASAADQVGTLIGNLRGRGARAARAVEDISHAATQPAMHVPGGLTPLAAPAPLRSAKPAPAMRNPAQNTGPANQYLPGYQQHDARLARVERALAARPASERNQRWQQSIGSTRQQMRNDMGYSAGSEFETRVEPKLRGGREVHVGDRGLSEQGHKELQQRWLTPRRDNKNMMMFDPQGVATQSENRGVSSVADHRVSDFIAQQRAKSQQLAGMIPQTIAPKLAAYRAVMALYGLRTA